MPSRIDIFHITIADAARPNVSLPNIIPSDAEELLVTARVREAPAGTRFIGMKVQIFHVGQRRWGAAGIFNVRQPYTPAHEIQPQPYDPAGINNYVVRVPHPPHDKFTATASPLASQLAMVVPELGALWDTIWHGDPGPYETEITLTPFDAAPAVLAGSEPISYSYVCRAVRI